MSSRLQKIFFDFLFQMELGDVMKRMHISDVWDLFGGPKLKKFPIPFCFLACVKEVSKIGKILACHSSILTDVLYLGGNSSIKKETVTVSFFLTFLRFLLWLYNSIIIPSVYSYFYVTELFVFSFSFLILCISLHYFEIVSSLPDLLSFR
jgi:hypothetical protein